MQTILLISLGAIVGANLRYFVAQQVTKLLPSAIPYGTLIVNVTGSFAIGFFMIWATERVVADPRWRLLIAVGFCGGYTTFSSYAYETLALMQQGQWVSGVLNVVGSNLLCLIAAVLGVMLARAV